MGKSNSPRRRPDPRPDYGRLLLLAYGRAELDRLARQPSTCWHCGAEVSEEAETCPACGIDLDGVPF